MCSGHDTHQNSPVTGAVAGDEIWLINARGLEGVGSFSSDQLDYLQHVNGCWNAPVGQEGFCQTVSQAQMPTVVFVHGYQTDLNDAQLRGLQVYRNIFQNACRCGSIRFVIWAWKSEKELCRPIQDFTMKSRRADQLGDVFALNLNLVGNQPLIVVCYSLGTQVVVSGLTRSSRYQGQPIQLAVIAAATDCGLGSCREQLWNRGNIRRSFIFTNRSDRAIRVARVTCRIAEGRRYRAFEEMAPLHSEQLGQVNLIDLSSVASRKHSIMRYTRIPVVQACIRQLVQDHAAMDSIGGPDYTATTAIVNQKITMRHRDIGCNVCTLR